MKKKYPFLEGAIPIEFISEIIQSHTHDNNIGGHSIFLGQVRADIIEEKEVEGIEFTSYQEMAIEKLIQIRKEIFTKYDLLCMHVHHSLGLVKKGGVCLFVFTSSKHRKPAILACDELVERIKKELPIWGKEIFSDSSYQWKENKQ
ncbi:molybdopterin synthase catalytic subunit [Apibacter mensalis]|uniref:Molybdopterin synthase catalytic subunit n=1 Tax=Apibacter mensalis TaxID=1586267 RepID=A0A0X3ARK9_9FLAO|nr:molybdenum cofactor biosynthesis protein MoaE [Apibacter mensalis]CVK17070.1 molybdopterin synthase catalytic subunit [Apibacter mensalis]